MAATALSVSELSLEPAEGHRRVLIRLNIECNDGYHQCGNGCNPVGTPCPSGGLRRRGLRANACPQGYSTCPLSPNPNHGRASFSYECLDTQTNIESCMYTQLAGRATRCIKSDLLSFDTSGGGCLFPLSGAALGRDCTSLSGVKDVQVWFVRSGYPPPPLHCLPPHLLCRSVDFDSVSKGSVMCSLAWKTSSLTMEYAFHLQ